MGVKELRASEPTRGAAASDRAARPLHYRSIKRTFDLLAAGAMLMFTLPLCAAIAAAVALDSPGPVIFRQTRVGRGGRPFTLYKFRTMRWGTPDLPTDQMARQKVRPVTRVGAVLRRFSLDELPQLVNVLKGEMSLVGPRPALPSQERLNALRRAYGVEALRPGITGWAQINGRDELEDDAKAGYDAYYRAHVGFWFDLTILARTLAPVCTGRGNR
jgi:O-antigen biosynthesis protein WbqP